MKCTHKLHLPWLSVMDGITGASKDNRTLNFCDTKKAWSGKRKRAIEMMWKKRQENNGTIWTERIETTQYSTNEHMFKPTPHTPSFSPHQSEPAYVNYIYLWITNSTAVQSQKTDLLSGLHCCANEEMHTMKKSKYKKCKNNVMVCKVQQTKNKTKNTRDTDCRTSTVVKRKEMQILEFNETQRKLKKHHQKVRNEQNSILFWLVKNKQAPSFFSTKSLKSRNAVQQHSTISVRKCAQLKSRTLPLSTTGRNLQQKVHRTADFCHLFFFFFTACLQIIDDEREKKRTKWEKKMQWY